MFLAVDIGNTRINASVFNEEKIIAEFCFDTLVNSDEVWYKHQFSVISSRFNITGCAIISVVNELDSIVKTACDDIFQIDTVILNVKNLSLITIPIPNPNCVGMDRIANVYAVTDFLLPAIIVDIGTAITFDILSAKREFLGGIIMPGVNMQLKALTDGTSKLPQVEAKKSDIVIGNTTETCILSGVIRGTAAAIDGLLAQCKKELGSCKTIILTGGQAELVSKYMHTKYPIDKDLTLKGIKKIYDLSC